MKPTTEVLGMAGYALAQQILVALLENGALTEEEARRIISEASRSQRGVGTAESEEVAEFLDKLSLPLKS